MPVKNARATIARTTGRGTTTNDVKYTPQTTTAAKSGTTTIGARPYSSANASTVNTGTSAVGKGTTTSTAKNTTSNPLVGKGEYVTAVPDKNTTGVSTVPKAQNPTPTMNTGLDAIGKSTTPNPVAASTYNPDAVGKGGYITAAPDKNEIYGDTLADTINPYLRTVENLAGAGSNPSVANMTPSQRTSLWGSVLAAAPGLATTTPGYQSLINLLDQTNRGRNVRNNYRLEGLDEEGKATRELAEREYSNPNFPYETVGIYDGMMQGRDAVGKYDNNAAINSLLDTLSAGAVDNDLRPYPTPNADYLTSGLGGYGADASASATSKSGGSGGGGTRSSGTSYAGDNGYMDISALYDLLNQRLGEYDANYETLLNSLNANYENMLNALGLNYADTEALLNSQLANSRGELEDSRKRALQEAYISRMMQEKNLADQLDAYGLTGGATESVLANMRNNYANNRNTVEENTQNSLRDLLLNYLNNVTTARQRYNDSLLNAQNSRVSALNDAANYRSQARAGAYEDLYNTLANLTMKGINYGS